MHATTVYYVCMCVFVGVYVPFCYVCIRHGRSKSAFGEGLGTNPKNCLVTLPAAVVSSDVMK